MFDISDYKVTANFDKITNGTLLRYPLMKLTQELKSNALRNDN